MSIHETVSMLENLLDIAYELETNNLFINDLSTLSFDVYFSHSNFHIKLNSIWDNNQIQVD